MPLLRKIRHKREVVVADDNRSEEMATYLDKENGYPVVNMGERIDDVPLSILRNIHYAPKLNYIYLIRFINFF